MRISTLLTLYFLTGLVLMPQLCMRAATNGINLCIAVVVPSLFPFFICSKILVKNGFAQRVSKYLHFIMRPFFNVPGCGAFAFVLGMLSGCPVGAKTVTDMFSKRMCTKAEAQRMLCFCNNSGPLFIIGSVSIGMLGYEEFGTILYVSHIISAVVVGIVMRFYKHNEIISKGSYYNNERNTDVLSTSVTESVSLTGYVCGFIIFFSVAIEIFKQSGLVEILCQGFSDKNMISGMLYGMLEMTNGISSLSLLTITPRLISVISFVLGFGGLSVIMQVYGIIKKYDFSILIFSVAKLFQGFVSAVVTYVLLSLCKIPLPVFADKTDFGILNHWAYCINFLSVFGITILFLSILIIVCKFLRRV